MNQRRAIDMIVAQPASRLALVAFAGILTAALSGCGPDDPAPSYYQPQNQQPQYQQPQYQQPGNDNQPVVPNRDRFTPGPAQGPYAPGQVDSPYN